jgi:hypothetical protein
VQDQPAGPIEVPALAGFVTPGTGMNWLCGIRAGTDAYCFGFNERGEIGDGVPGRRYVGTPQRVRAP